MKRIGIIIPNYNRLKLLERCLTSLKKQTNTSFNVYIVDSSDEEGFEIIKENYCDDKIFIFLRTNKKGLPVQRNIGIDLALKDNVEYITFIDSDDVVVGSYLQDLLDMANDDIDVVSTRLRYDYPSKALDVNNLRAKDNVVLNPIEATCKLLDGKLSASACGKLYKSNIFLKERFNEDLTFNEDYEFNCRVILKQKRILSSNYRGYYYCNNGVSMTKRKVIPNKDLYSLIYSNYLSLIECYKHNDNGLILSCEQLLADNLLGVYPRFNFRKMDKQLKNRINIIVSDEKVVTAVKNYIPYNRNTKIKKRLYLLNKTLFSIFFKFRLIFVDSKHGVADR